MNDICSVFGCGKKLTSVEKLCGDKCLSHQNDIYTVGDAQFVIVNDLLMIDTVVENVILIADICETINDNNMQFQVNQKVELTKNNTNDFTAKKTKKGTKGIIVSIPKWRNDICDVLFDGDKLPEPISFTDLKLA